MPRNTHEHSPSVADVFDTFLTDCRGRHNLSANTVKSYRADLGLVAQMLTLPIQDITLREIEQFLAMRDEKPATTNRRIASLRRFFLWAQRQGYCVKNPMVLVEPKQDDERLPRPIRLHHELRALDAAIQSAEQPFRLMFTMLRETGMRAGEVVQLNVGDVVLDLGREGLRVREAKNNRERIVVLTSDEMPRTMRGLRTFLRELGPNVPATTPLFRSNRGTRLSYDALHYQWERVCRTANLIDVVEGKEQPRYTLHQLRHTVGSNLITQLPEQIVSRMLGHRDPRSTRRYAEVTEDQVRVALAQKRKR